MPTLSTLKSTLGMKSPKMPLFMTNDCYQRTCISSPVNFINILDARFSYESKLNIFSLITFGFKIFCSPNYWQKVLHNMLMKLTPGGSRKKASPFKKYVTLFWHISRIHLQTRFVTFFQKFLYLALIGFKLLNE